MDCRYDEHTKPRKHMGTMIAPGVYRDLNRTCVHASADGEGTVLRETFEPKGSHHTKADEVAIKNAGLVEKVAPPLSERDGLYESDGWGRRTYTPTADTARLIKADDIAIKNAALVEPTTQDVWPVSSGAWPHGPERRTHTRRVPHQVYDPKRVERRVGYERRDR